MWCGSIETGTFSSSFSDCHEKTRYRKKAFRNRIGGQAKLLQCHSTQQRLRSIIAKYDKGKFPASIQLDPRPTNVALHLAPIG